MRSRDDGSAGTPALVFDLDGTLVDTAPDLHAVLETLLAEIGRHAPPLDQTRLMVGEGARVMITRALDATGGMPADVDMETLFERFIEIYVADPARYSRPYEGVLSELDRLAAAGVAMGICTNKPQAPSDGLLATLDMTRYFGAVLGGDALPVRKPDPEHLAAVLRGMGVAEGAPAVMVGDSRTDLLTARALGVPCILVSFGYTAIPARELGADAVIDAFAELPAALAALGLAA